MSNLHWLLCTASDHKGVRFLWGYFVVVVILDTVSGLQLICAKVWWVIWPVVQFFNCLSLRVETESIAGWVGWSRLLLWWTWLDEHQGLHNTTGGMGLYVDKLTQDIWPLSFPCWHIYWHSVTWSNRCTRSWLPIMLCLRTQVRN